MGRTACTEPQCLYSGALYLLPCLIGRNYCAFYGLLRHGISVALLRCPLVSGFVYGNDMEKAVEGSGVHF